MAKKAAVLGATGLVGRSLVQELLADERYEEVHLYARRSPELSHPKIREHIGDLLEGSVLEGLREQEHLYCALGTTRAKTPELTRYKAIDYGIPLEAARIGKEGGLERFLLVSAIGADPGSRLFYPRIKGQLEQDLKQLSLPGLHIFQPAIILGERGEQRWAEALGKAFFQGIGPLIPRRYRAMPAHRIAQAMHAAAFREGASRNWTVADMEDLLAE